MAGTKFNITVDDAELQTTLARLGSSDTGDLMSRLGEHLQRSTEARFTSQTGPDGRPWAPLSPEYARTKKYHKDKVLTLRGYLRGGIRHQVVGPTAVEVGSNRRYAAIHQFGGTINQAAQSRQQLYRSVAGRVLFAGKRHKKGVTQRWVSRPAYQIIMPARPFLGLSADDHQQISQVVRDWVLEKGGA